jgi:dGTPase
MTVLRHRDAYEREERERLGAWAVKSAESLGRVTGEEEHAYRTVFQRDRDRIVHSSAFRRLEYKTQVFVYHEGDHHRNRLTHTLEGSQISRTIARVLRLNEDLAEAVVLAHDLGHTPFGHAGERVLDELMKDDGGFDHNRQSLRIVDLLEDRYPGFRGLNLTYETREGILKHGIKWDHPVPVPDLREQPSLEAQVADHADEIAYMNHDVDDGLRSGLVTWEQLEAVPLWCEMRAELREQVGSLPPRVHRAQMIRGLLNRMVTGLVEETAARLAHSGVDSVDAVRGHAEPLVGFPADLRQARAELKAFLNRELYQHPKVREMNDRATGILGDLFRSFRADPRLLPAHVRGRIDQDGEARAIADYVAGMTDRFAIGEHERLCGGVR